MGHLVHGTRFGDRRYVAWHALGQVFLEDLGAVAAFKAIGQVFIKKVKLLLPDGSESGYYGLIREADETAPQEVLGVAKEDYTLITPQVFCEVWDSKVKQTIETIGVLKGGAMMFLTTALPSYAVKGDEVTRYMVATNGMDGNTAASVAVSETRVVCFNTWKLAHASATENYRIVHDETAVERMGFWLEDIYERSLAKAEALAEVYNIFAETRVSKAQAEKVLLKVYPAPVRPEANAPTETMQVRYAQWENLVERQASIRQAAMSLYQGAGTGMDTVAAAGTAWGLFNAITENENWRRGLGKASIDESVVFGERAKTMTSGFVTIRELVGVK